jgi:hypothetical protein
MRHPLDLACVEKFTAFLLTELRAAGGFTFEPRTLRFVRGEDVWAVSLPGLGLTLDAEPTVRDLEDFFARNAAAFARRGTHAGGWHDVRHGSYYLDVSVLVHSLREAIALAAAFGQLAVTNLQTLETVYVESAAVAA